MLSDEQFWNAPAPSDVTADMSISFKLLHPEKA
jgi:hypothetical protein